MTLKTSLFNGGIYRSTVRRYRLGAVLYFIILFMCTCLPILFSVDPKRYLPMVNGRDYELILRDVYLYAPLVISIAVPTVTALLVYRFIHSKKGAIFIHSLPVTRAANYISNLAAALTLMAVPVILNGALLALISVCGWGKIFSVSSCVIWTAINLLSLFLMFSVATFCAFLTGSSFALVALNILVHIIAIILAASVSSLATVFLYGYYETNFILNAVAENNFVVYIMELANNLSVRRPVPFSIIKLGIMLVSALAFYIISLFLYKKRRMETAEDIAAYRILNPIFKYLVTFLFAIGTFAICSYSLQNGVLYPIFIVVLISAVVYFALEMMLRKSLKVWSSYKGYLAFLVLFALVVGTFAFTSFFGYETRVPEPSDTAAVAVYHSRAFEDIPYVEDEEITKYALEIHRELVLKENITTLETYRDSYLYFDYKLRDGSTINRRYSVTEAMFCEVMNSLYESQEYKLENLDLFSDKIGEIYNIELAHGDKKIDEKREIAELISCLQEDLLALSYTETRNHNSWSFNVWINYIRADEMDVSTENRGIHQLHLNVNANYTRTLNWLREHGYLERTFNPSNYDLTVLTAEQWQSFEEAGATKEEIMLREASGVYYGPTVTVEEARTFENIPDAVRISDAATKAKVREFVQSTSVNYVPDKEYAYYVCTIAPSGDYVSIVAAFYDDASAVWEFIR